MSSKQSVSVRSSHQTPEYISLLPCVLHVPHILISRFTLLLLLLLLLALCQYLFFTCDHFTYADFLKFLYLHALYSRRLHIDALFFISVMSRFNMLAVSFGYYCYSRSSSLISETPPCLLLLPKTLRLPDVFLPLTICATTSVS